MGVIITRYGLGAGLVIIVVNTATLETGFSEAWLGFLVMFVAFSSIFIAVKNFRDHTLGGIISFGTALTMGLGIAALASVVYVSIWELYLWLTDYQFIDDYINATLEANRAAGAAELAIAEQEAAQLRALYDNVFMRLPMTFLEIFPVGLLVALVSAGVLRNHRS